MNGRRILFLDGPGDLIGAYRSWRAGRHDPTQTDHTFSGQLFDVARASGATVLAIAWPGDRAVVEENGFRVEHRSAPFPRARGALFHAAQAAWALELSALALRFRADVLVHASGPYPFLFAPLKARGVSIVAVLHNTFWPVGHRPTGRGARLVAAAHGWFHRRVADATLAVSPECERQVRALARTLRGPVEQFRPSYAGRLGTPCAEELKQPFRVLYAGRVEREKGVLDVIEAAARLESLAPGRFEWSICGGGSGEAEVAQAVATRALSGRVLLRGRLQRQELLGEFQASHAVIVPTTVGFNEGLNRVALEAALAGRPAIVSDVTPAVDVLGEAALVVPAGDVDGYVRALQRLAGDPAFYRAASGRAVDAGDRLLDPALSFGAVLARTLAALPRPRGGAAR